MKLFKKVTLTVLGIVVIVAVGFTTIQTVNAASIKNHTSVTKVNKKITPNKQIISKKLQGTWYFFDIAGRKHVMVITGNTLKLDNQKAYVVGKNGFAYYYSDGIYQLGFDYTDNGYSFRTKVQKVNGRWVNTLVMISANYTGTRGMTRNHSHHFETQNFFN